MSRRNSILMLGLMSTFIIISGIMFIIYCYYVNVKFTIMNNRIPGMVFGVVTVFLGARYLKSVFKLRKALDNSDAKFSWSNVKSAFNDLKHRKAIKVK